MKSLITIMCLIFLTGCRKENTGNPKLLSRITVNGKVNESFEYNRNGQLIKDNFYFWDCSSPADEYFYIYKDSKLDTLRSVLRSLYSGTAAICNPLAGFHSYAAFKYDTLGRINKIERDNSITRFSYNNQGKIDKQIIDGGGTNLYVSTFKYDARGNLVEANDGQGNITQYEFDTKINPYFLIKRHPGTITAFFASPNNVVRVILPGGSSEIKYTYNPAGLPNKMIDPNGLTYLFEYQ